ncbi:hypothetical protein NDU88_001887 [Pleurodeles waltl]|uniref:Uncharacterized protein n=1 Tax=Pleurodeles waltl TaxID=8319 RepID=A0AAV7P578_PLEWA|nr:hypothetical protein NDU88_001887 [Pleurodeles waltl]
MCKQRETSWALLLGGREDAKGENLLFDTRQCSGPLLTFEDLPSAGGMVRQDGPQETTRADARYAGGIRGWGGASCRWEGRGCVSLCAAPSSGFRCRVEAGRQLSGRA